MADFVFNIAKGVAGARIKDVVDGVDADGVIRMLFLTASAADATAQDYDTVAAVLGDAGTTEATQSARQALTCTYTVDDATNDRFSADAADVTVTPTGTETLTDVVIYWDPTGASADSACIPLTQHDFALTTDAEFTVQIADFYRAT